MASKYPDKTLEKVPEKPVPAKEPIKEKKPKNVKRKFVGYGLFQAELDNFLEKELAEEGYSGIEVRRTPAHTEVNVVASRTQQVLGERGNRLRELTTSVVKRFDLNPNSIELFVEKVAIRGLCAAAMCEQLRYKLCGGLPVRRACYGVLRFIMESGATGCEIVVSGKIRGQRAKAMKFVDGVMLHSGEAVNRYIDEAVRHVQMKAGVLGIRVKIMLTQDKEGRKGPREPLPDKITISELEDKAPMDLVPESLLKEYPNLQLPVTIYFKEGQEVFVPNQKQRDETVQKQLEEEQKQREEEQKKLEEAQKQQDEAAQKQLEEQNPSAIG